MKDESIKEDEKPIDPNNKVQLGLHETNKKIDALNKLFDDVIMFFKASSKRDHIIIKAKINK